MLPYRKYADAPGSRFWEILAGAVLGLFGLLCAALAVFGSYRMVERQILDTSGAVFVGILLLLASGVGITAFRLISGRGRKSDGGLFPPWFLRALGLLFLAAGVLVPFIDMELLDIMIGALSLGVGCFYLANRQERRTQELRLSGNDT